VATRPERLDCIMTHPLATRAGWSRAAIRARAHATATVPPWTVRMMASTLLAVSTISPGVIEAASSGRAGEEIRRELTRRFEPSRIEIEDPGRAGEVVRRGRMLVLTADGIPAKPFRVVEVGRTYKVRHHVMDFARVEIASQAVIAAEPAPYTLLRGTRMVVVELKLSGSDVRLLTHTAEPLGALPDGELVYGCTEFVFRFSPEALAGASVEPVVGLIERWLDGDIVDRTCREGILELCLQP
jgi:hypothetical protein